MPSVCECVLISTALESMRNARSFSLNPLDRMAARALSSELSTEGANNFDKNCCASSDWGVRRRGAIFEARKNELFDSSYIMRVGRCQFGPRNPRKDGMRIKTDRIHPSLLRHERRCSASTEGVKKHRSRRYRKTALMYKLRREPCNEIEPSVNGVTVCSGVSWQSFF